MCIILSILFFIRREIKIVDSVMIIDLIKNRNAVVGTVGLEFEKGNILIISTKAVIHAIGGAENLCIVGDRSYKTLARLLEVENFITIGQIVAAAAMMRTETRGAHNREDYPELDETWTKNIIIQLKNNQMTMDTKPTEQF
jgi:succinate dehydrogenase/fumarate reductase flavoprotein subunit